MVHTECREKTNGQGKPQMKKMILTIWNGNHVSMNTPVTIASVIASLVWHMLSCLAVGVHGCMATLDSIPDENINER